ncbi:MutS -like protein 6 [Caligus rogercresseyi]|uniref:MutS -like protein 6 n=1 Tax=Caligus rogercresseyi TaxID=217165 RepID=A0A7T8GXW6_CALRO|nr:MutS -like protein 6 [Caligus rogercresseyi]
MSGSILKYFSPKSKESTPKRPSEATSSPLSVSSSLRPSNGSPLSSKRVFSPLLSSALSPSPSPKRLKVDSSAMTHPPSQLGGGGGDSSQDYIHLNLAFLKDDKRKDAQGRRPGSPGYDPNTLYLPDSFLCGVTPAQRQWWSLKASNFSSLLFFKMGKMRDVHDEGEIAHCGFPEASFERYAEILISRGTPSSALSKQRPQRDWRSASRRRQRIRNGESGEAPGTRLGEKSHAESELLVALILHEGTLGFCSVDCSMGIIQIGQWKEEEQPTQAFSNTQLVLCQINPLEFLLEAEEKNQKLSSHLETRFPAVKRTLIQAPSPTDTIDKIIRAKYFSSVQDWPSVLKRLVRFEEESPLAREGLESSLMALGTVISFLSDSLIDYGILAQGKMEDFHASSSSSNRSQKIMILDDSSLYNLDVLPKGKKSHSLLGILDNTSTPIGRPLFARSDILRRQEAIAELSGGSEPGSLSNNYLSDIKTLFKRLPDFERLTGIIACNGFGYPPGHPEHRAVYIDASLLSKKKLTKFLDCLNGFKAAHNGLKSLLGKHDFKSALLLKLLEEDYPLSKMDEVIRSFESSMDIPSAVKRGASFPQQAWILSTTKSSKRNKA